MKRRLLTALIVGLFASLGAQAQDCTQNEEMRQKLSIFSEYAKARNYNEAYPVWKEVYTGCPKLHYAVFAYGERILQDKIKNSTGSAKEAFVKELLELYTNYNKIFARR